MRYPKFQKVTIKHGEICWSHSIIEERILNLSGPLCTTNKHMAVWIYIKGTSMCLQEEMRVNMNVNYENS